MKRFALVFVFCACDSSGGLTKAGYTQAAGSDGASWGKSLAGSTMDGALDVDGEGHFVADVAARRLFDWALSVTGEVQEDALEERLTTYVRQALVSPAQGEALQVLGQYLAYRRAGSMLGKEPDVASRLAALVTLRNQFFTPAVHQGLFGDEEARAQAAIAQMVAPTEPGSASNETVLNVTLPPAAQRAHAMAQAPLTAYRTEATLRAAGASDSTVSVFRTQTFGFDAAARLQALDQKNAAFFSLVAELKSERASLVAGGASPAALSSWLEGAVVKFAARDQHRARALLSR